MIKCALPDVIHDDHESERCAPSPDVIHGDHEGEKCALPDVIHDDHKGKRRVLPLPKAPDGLIGEGLVDDATHSHAIYNHPPKFILPV
jgi:hypothetical protein